MARKAPIYAIPVLALPLFASFASAEPIDDAFALCTAAPSRALEVGSALRNAGWQPIDIAADADARQQLALAVLMQKVPSLFFGDRVAQIPQVVDQLDFGEPGATVTFAKPGALGRDIVNVTQIESSVFDTSRCLIAGHSADNPVIAAQYEKAKNAINPSSPAWMTQIPLSPNVPGASSSRIVATLISEEAREGFLGSIVLADIAFDALISFPKEAK